MPSTGLEPATPASERPKTHALDRAATAIDENLITEVRLLPERNDINKSKIRTLSFR